MWSPNHIWPRLAQLAHQLSLIHSDDQSVPTKSKTPLVLKLRRLWVDSKTPIIAGMVVIAVFSAIFIGRLTVSDTSAQTTAARLAATQAINALTRSLPDPAQTSAAPIEGPVSATPTAVATSPAPTPSAAAVTVAPMATAATETTPPTVVEAPQPVVENVRTLSVTDACTGAVKALAVVWDALVATAHSDISNSEGHSLGTQVVALQDITTTSADLQVAALLPPLTSDVMSVRSQMLSGGTGTTIDVNKLTSDGDTLNNYCSAHLDPLGSQ